MDGCGYAVGELSMKASHYDEETAGLALVGCLGLCIVCAFVILFLLMWGVV